MFSAPHRNIIIALLIFAWWPGILMAQKLSEANTWMLRELLRAPSGNNPIRNHTFLNEPYLFWPDDLILPEPHYNSAEENIVKINNRLFYPIPGTGRVYEITEKNNRIVFTRQDSTIFFGHNFGASYFNHRDTLMALGGYGFWKFNGQLTFFDPMGHNWEIRALNYTLPHDFGHNGIFHDVNKRRVTILNTPHINHDLKAYYTNTDGSKGKDTLSMFQLDLDHKNWRKLGLPKTEAFKIIMGYPKIGTHPFGELLITLNRNNIKLWLINYEENRIEYLKNQMDVAEVINLYISEDKAQTTRIITYFNNQDSTFNFLSSKKITRKISMRKKDFEHAGIKVYDSGFFTDLKQSLTALNLSVLINLMIVGFGLFLFIRYKNQIKQTALNSNLDFDEVERQIILKVYNSPNHQINLHEIDHLLGKRLKTVDALNKKRSIVIRSINIKYELLTNDPDLLITSNRLKDDRRMFIYKTDPEKINRIRPQLDLPPVK